MLEQIRNDPVLSKIIKSICSENEISMEISNQVLSDNYLILKVDEYYNSKQYKPPLKCPPSVDCLIIVRCKDNSYNLYFVELKNIQSPDGFEIKKIVEKFKTTIEQFMDNKFSFIFNNENYKINQLKMYFVSDPLRIRQAKEKYNITDEQIRKKINSSKLEKFQSMKPFRFREHIVLIEPCLPNPLVSPC